MIVQDKIRRVNKVMTIIKRNDKKRIINLWKFILLFN